jgi:hypothetical protein
MRCPRGSKQVFQVSIAELSPESLQSESEPESQPDLHLIPEEYRAEFAKVFSKKEAEVLPQHGSYDHTIVLQEGTTPAFAGQAQGIGSVHQGQSV